MPDHLPSSVSARRPRRRRAPLAFALVAALAATPGTAGAATPQQVADARDRAAAWLVERQQPSGSLGSSRGLDAAWALLGLAGHGTHAADLRPAGALAAPSAQDHYAGLWAAGDDAAWSSNGTPQATDYARTILIARAAGVDPTRVAPAQNLPAKLARFWRSGYFQSRTAVLNQTIFGLLALERVAATPPGLVAQLADHVEAAQHDDGGYGYVTAESQPAVPGGPSPLASPSDVDLTGAALAALCGAGRTIADASVADAVTFLATRRRPSGAIGTGTIGNVDANAWALQGLGACGVRPGTAAWTTGGFDAAVDWLLATQRADGAWALYPELSASQPADPYATQDVLRALVDAPGFAIEPPARATPGDPVWRPVVTPPSGTAISVALAIDTGFAAERRFCEVPTVEGASLRDLLAAARTAATPSDCLSDVRWDGATLSVLNERRSVSPSGGWRWSVDGERTESAADAGRSVTAGAVVGLRLVEPFPERVPADPVGPGPSDPGPEPPAPEPPGPDPQPRDPGPAPPAPPAPRAPSTPKAPVNRTVVRTSCRRTASRRAVRCTSRATRRFTVTARLPGRKAVRRSGARRVVTTVRSSRALRPRQHVRLRIVVGTRSRVVAVRADGRPVVSRV
jgi:hypothetical protein